MAVVLWIIALLMLLLTVVDPRQLWYATTAWQFKHPEANEPSEASFAMGRVLSGICAAGFGVAAIATTASGLGPLTQERLDTLGRAAASELSGEYYKYASPGVTAIEDAIGRDDVVVTEGRTVTEDAGFGESYGIQEYFALAGAEDDSVAGCLEVSYDGGLFHEGDIDVDVSYGSGSC
ncbi:hypothetical protein F4692_001626 [Nocardioides cavernae]|uniref:DUF6199 domain-containing protein n=1 Tax=Nocardioides cavernae TaxID=1921566 RepID=A0A7Y9KT51_9ACTN|nr:DUF6199 family natural product biosynthesis protein [Nocardioides cavernae]NYE36493.1 hypothetical protein [Nocardioides cavernae]